MNAGNERARWFRLPGRMLAWLMIKFVRLYQATVSPLLPDTCRFQPTCSQYMIEAIRTRGPVVGLAKGLWRLLRCNPFCPGGYDPVDGAPGREHDGQQ